MYFREYFCSFSSKSYYFYILGVSHLNRTPIVMAKHRCSCVHFSGISTCGRTSRETVSHPQCPPLPTIYKMSLPVYVIVTNKWLQPLTITWYIDIIYWCYLFHCWKFNDVWLNIGVFCAPCMFNQLMGMLFALQTLLQKYYLPVGSH